MYPADPYEFARALWFEEYADTALVEVIGPQTFFPRIVGEEVHGQGARRSGESRRRSTRSLPVRLDYLESQLGTGP